MQTFTVTKEDSGMRLDIFLASMTEQTRSRTQKLIKEELVFVNDKIKSPHYKIKEGDIIQIVEKRIELIPQEEFELNVVFQNKDFIVIDKPSGIIVHPPHQPFDKITLVDLLVKKFPEIMQVGEKERPGIVHRLDKDVSGLMVVARNKDAFEYLKKEFKTGNIKKIYTGLVMGKVKKQTGEIALRIGRSARSKRMAARPESQEGKEALTYFRVTKKFTNSTLLEIELKTGRTHQIRAHFHAIGHPLAGDPLYKPKRVGKIVPPRIFLHSATLGFNNMDQDWVEFDSPLPDDLQDYLKELKKL
ncbi:RluA family pseudouridine synthase [Candidatus Saccharibacteria bacterium]|nr:RluA family pseudouridine synthase [Candidatus Saccharibacteria bacterium]NIV04096.1 RluA family pseudouridine synthase [Calditrichia bacterium]NIV72495.1 RluA family pseudouridine synthase [Calditrichia bacterium]NIV99600.1 RluA family pseudouridine synthase [Candidatus Saccharibacteria bacterium]